MKMSKQTLKITKSKKDISPRDQGISKNGKKDGWFLPKLISIALSRRVSTKIPLKQSPSRTFKPLNRTIKTSMIVPILSAFNQRKSTFTSMQKLMNKNGRG